MVPKILEIPHKMVYLDKLYEASYVPHDSMNLPIVNVCRLLYTDTPPY